MHTRSAEMKMLLKGKYKKLTKFMADLSKKFNLHLVAYNPNRCQGKKYDNQRTYYSYHDLLFIKNKNA